MPPITVVCQLSLNPIKAPVPSCNSNVGFANTLGTPNGVSSGPMARRITVFDAAPSTIKPPIITLSAVCTKLRVLMLLSMAVGGVPLGVGVVVGLGVGVAVGLGVGVGLGGGVEFTTVTVPTILQQAPCGVQKYGNVPTALNMCVKIDP